LKKIMNNSLIKEFYADGYKNLSIYRAPLMGIAAIIILLYHMPQRIIPVIDKIMYCGVDIFLFVSGMGLFYSIKKSSILDFYKNRIIRILPAYYIALILFFIFDVTTSGNLIGNLKNLLLFATGIRFFVFQRTLLWYVPAIIAFYLVFPLFYKLIIKIKFFALLTAVFISAVLSVAAHIFQFVGLQIIITRLPVFILGAYVSYLISENKKFNKLNLSLIFLSLIFGIIALLISFLSAYNLYSSGLYWWPFLFITLPLCLIFCFIVKLINSIKVNKALAFIGAYSLEMYILQEKIYEEIGKLVNNSPAAIKTISYFGSIIIIFILSIILKKISNYILRSRVKLSTM